ncbi:MAG: ThiF family adenylyltransferase, partial [candidate division Zixibacteria bacterium]|nr:ThiF family adenylyltransferase [candidate division Zixibacteria bacterium]
MKIISPMGRSRLSVSVRGGASLEKINDRHIPVIGEYAQRIISTLTMGIIGLGGIGSILVEMIMRLLPGKIVIADDDVLEFTNLNRVVGANYKDAKRALLKTDLAARTISRFNTLQDFSAVNGNFLDESVQRKFKECDVIFSATDNVSSRFAACNLCLANGIALIDVGTGVIMKDGKVEAA